MKMFREEARDIPVLDEVDVIVAGGGLTGVIAAISATRKGAKTLLIEQHGFLGGVAALGVPIKGFHDDNNRQIVGGIPWELIERLIKEGASPGLFFFDSEECAGGSIIQYDNFKLRNIVFDMVCREGVTLLLHTMAASPIKE